MTTVVYYPGCGCCGGGDVCGCPDAATMPDTLNGTVIAVGSEPLCDRGPGILRPYLGVTFTIVKDATLTGGNPDSQASGCYRGQLSPSGGADPFRTDGGIIDLSLCCHAVPSGNPILYDLFAWRYGGGTSQVGPTLCDPFYAEFGIAISQFGFDPCVLEVAINE